MTADVTDIEHIRADIARGCYAAYVEGRPDRMAAVLADGFTFSSPRDDHIDQSAYFARCWPDKPPFRAIDIERLVFDGDTAIIGYRAEKHDGTAFRNIELMRFDGDRVAEVTVYFGRDA